MKFSTSLIENAVQEFAKLPGVGRRIALRFVLHLLRQDPQYSIALAQNIIKLRTEIKYCECCNALSDSTLCQICSNPNREKTILCVVSDIRDMIAIENTNHFSGYFHVLGGLISPIDGIGPNQLSIDKLISRLQNEEFEEVILALPTTAEGETTTYYLYKHLSNIGSFRITTLSKGIAIGDQIEYVDELTLGRALIDRIPLEQAFQPLK